MTVNKTNPKVDFFFNKTKQWKEEVEKLRKIVLECDLNEELKWGNPCYTSQGNNIVLIHVFKNYCALLLFKGALLKDPEDILIQQTKNVQVARQIRFTNAQEIVEKESIIKSYISEAIEVEKKGLKVTLKKTDEYEMPEEFEDKLEENPYLKKAFYELTPGRQRAYLLYFSAPKQTKTRTSRVEKYTPQILAGKGLND